jgi:cysteine-rich repeat protein
VRRFAVSVVLGAAACGASPPAFPEGDSGTHTGGEATSTMSGASESTSLDLATSDTGFVTQSTGSDTGSESSGADDGPAVCGDGIQASGEACDDANRSEIDGCTSSCERGPTGVRRVGGPQPSPLVTYSNNDPPVTMNADCPEGEAMLGLDIGWPKGVGGLTVRCAALGLVDADPTAIEVVAGSILAPLGAYPGDDFAIACPAGEVFGELSTAGTQGALFGFGGACRTLDVTGSGGDQTLAIGEGTDLEYQGFGMVQDLTACPDGTIATGIAVQMLASEWPVGVGLRCHTLELRYP